MKTLGQILGALAAEVVLGLGLVALFGTPDAVAWFLIIWGGMLLWLVVFRLMVR